MKFLSQKSLGLVFLLALVGAGFFWSNYAMAAKPERVMLPVAGLKQACPSDPLSSDASRKYDDSGPHPGHDAVFLGVGSFKEENVPATRCRF